MNFFTLFILSIYTIDIQKKKPTDTIETKKSSMVESLLMDIKKLSTEIEKIKFSDDGRNE